MSNFQDLIDDLRPISSGISFALVWLVTADSGGMLVTEPNIAPSATFFDTSP